MYFLWQICFRLQHSDVEVILILFLADFHEISQPIPSQEDLLVLPRGQRRHPQLHHGHRRLRHPARGQPPRQPQPGRHGEDRRLSQVRVLRYLQGDQAACL